MSTVIVYMEPEIVTKPPKKPRSEAQKKATENALNILKSRREAKKEETIRAEKPPAASHDYVTKKDLEAYMAMKSAPVPKKAVAVVESESESEPEPVVQKKPRARLPVAAPPPPVKLSGYALLDEMFFSHR